MVVKRSQSAARVLQVLELIANHQPVGVSELARLLGANKSAAQRDVMTLADAGWIQAAAGTPTRWELSGRIHAIARMAHGSSDLRRRARSTLEELQRTCGETVLLAVPEGKQFVVIDIAETTHFLRTSAYIGLVIPTVGSATGRAFLPFLDESRQLDLLGVTADARMRRHFRETLQQGYAVSVGEVYEGSTNVASAIFDSEGYPEAVIVVSAPSDRLARKYHGAVGEMVRAAARKLSRAEPAVGVGRGSAEA